MASGSPLILPDATYFGAIRWVDDLVFYPHPMTRGLDDYDLPILADMRSATQATYEFPNRWSVSILTMTPTSATPMWVVHGDSRVPTYEVAIFNPSGDMVGSPDFYVSKNDLQKLLDAVEAR